jgi:hypothetical protein
MHLQLMRSDFDEEESLPLLLFGDQWRFLDCSIHQGQLHIFPGRSLAHFQPVLMNLPVPLSFWKLFQSVLLNPDIPARYFSHKFFQKTNTEHFPRKGMRQHYLRLRTFRLQSTTLQQQLFLTDRLLEPRLLLHPQFLGFQLWLILILLGHLVFVLVMHIILHVHCGLKIQACAHEPSRVHLLRRRFLCREQHLLFLLLKLTGLKPFE